MPKLPTSLAKSVVFMFNTAEDARLGRKPQATGFICGLRSKQMPGAYYAFCVTNWHVAVGGWASHIRINTTDGGVAVIERHPSDWSYLPNRHDVAAIAMKISEGKYDISVLLDDMFLTQANVSDGLIGCGDDVFMIGLFVDAFLSVRNVPAVRFGNISIMPGQGIRQPNGVTLENFVLDFHSRTGFSGSPAFVYRTTGTDLSIGDSVTGPPMIKLLGIHFSQFSEFWQVVVVSKQQAAAADGAAIVVEGNYARGMSGMSTVAPAWAIFELLTIEPMFAAAIGRSEALLVQKMSLAKA